MLVTVWSLQFKLFPVIKDIYFHVLSTTVTALAAAQSETFTANLMG